MAQDEGTSEVPDEFAGMQVGDLAIEIAYLRGVLRGREQECQQMMADKMVMQAQTEALMRTIADLSVRVATLCSAVTELMAGTQAIDMSATRGLLS